MDGADCPESVGSVRRVPAGGKRCLIHDRCPLFTSAFAEILKAAGVKVVKLPPMSPNLNPHGDNLGEKLGVLSLQPCDSSQVELFLSRFHRPLRLGLLVVLSDVCGPPLDSWRKCLQNNTKRVLYEMN